MRRCDFDETGHDAEFLSSAAKRDASLEIPTAAQFRMLGLGPRGWRVSGTSLDMLAGQGLGEHDLDQFSRYQPRFQVAEGEMRVFYDEATVARRRAEHGVDLSRWLSLTIVISRDGARVDVRRFLSAKDASYSHEVEGHLLTHHARLRSEHRSFTKGHIRAALSWGDLLTGKGAYKYVITKKSVRKAAAQGEDISEFFGTTVVVAQRDGESVSEERPVILTVYSNRRLDHARDERFYFRDGKYRRASKRRS